MENTTLVYLERDGKYLMLHRVLEENDINRDKWLGVGGHFEEGESPYECAIREVFEETGYVLAEARYRAVITFVADVCESEQMHLFTSSAFLGEPIPCNEGVLEWVDKEKIPTLPMWEGDILFITLLEKRSDFFSLKLVYEKDKLIEAVLDGVPLEKNAEGKFVL
jgi:8-oxo-dGTP diphosphatase